MESKAGESDPVEGLRLLNWAFIEGWVVWVSPKKVSWPELQAPRNTMIMRSSDQSGPHPGLGIQPGDLLRFVSVMAQLLQG